MGLKIGLSSQQLLLILCALRLCLTVSTLSSAVSKCVLQRNAATQN